MQRRFRSLAAFELGPVALSALAAIWGDDDTSIAREAATDLVRRGLLSDASLPAAPSTQPLYRVHPVIHAYAAARLDAERETARAHRLHSSLRRKRLTGPQKRRF
jgi:hypothetical protein